MPPPYASRVTVETAVDIPLQNDAAAGTFLTFAGLPDEADHLAVRFGRPGSRPLVRLHSECLTGDVFGSRRCDCGAQLSHALTVLRQEGGYLLYLRQEGRGIGLRQKLRAYRLQDAGADTFEANERLGLPSDARDFSVAAAMLEALGISRIELMTNNPAKAHQLREAGIDVRERSAGVFQTRENSRYLAAKRDKRHHRLDLGQASGPGVEPAPDEALRSAASPP